MLRLMTIAGCVLGLALALPLGSAAEAAKKPKNKMCMAKALDGKAVSFKCAANEKCCFNYLTSQGTCPAATATCL